MLGINLIDISKMGQYYTSISVTNREMDQPIEATWVTNLFPANGTPAL